MPENLIYLNEVFTRQLSRKMTQLHGFAKNLSGKCIGSFKMNCGQRGLLLYSFLKIRRTFLLIWEPLITLLQVYSFFI